MWLPTELFRKPLQPCLLLQRLPRMADLKIVRIPWVRMNRLCPPYTHHTNTKNCFSSAHPVSVVSWTYQERLQLSKSTGWNYMLCDQQNFKKLTLSYCWLWKPVIELSLPDWSCSCGIWGGGSVGNASYLELLSQVQSTACLLQNNMKTCGSSASCVPYFICPLVDCTLLKMS